MAIMLIISSLLVRASRANAFVSSVVPFLQQMKIAWMLKSVCRGLSKRALIQAVQESKEPQHAGNTAAGIAILTARDTWAWGFTVHGEETPRQEGTGADSARGCLY